MLSTKFEREESVELLLGISEDGGKDTRQLVAFAV